MIVGGWEREIKDLRTMRTMLGPCSLQCLCSTGSLCFFYLVLIFVNIFFAHFNLLEIWGNPIPSGILLLKIAVNTSENSMHCILLYCDFGGILHCFCLTYCFSQYLKVLWTDV